MGRGGGLNVSRDGLSLGVEVSFQYIQPQVQVGPKSGLWLFSSGRYIFSDAVKFFLSTERT